MKIAFLSNYFNHHQKYVSNEFFKIADSYFFVSTSAMREERKKLGYGENELPQYVCSFNENPEIVSKCINESDIVITGSAPEEILNDRKKNKKIIFRYSERPLKNGFQLWKYPIRFLKWRKSNPKNVPIYMLCASAYTSLDYSRFGLFINRSYKWGYFPECKKYNDLNLLYQKKDAKKILWCGRFLDWKHPDDVLKVALRLKKEGYCFHIDMIGTGEMELYLKQYVADNNLDDVVSFLGSMKPSEVREHMEKAGIYLFTSDKKEGWGAVLNESMNSGCAVIASHLIGAVPYLIKNNESGIIYKSQNIDMLYEKVKYLLDNPDVQKRLGLNAYNTITEVWNANVAVERFSELSTRILKGEKFPDLYTSGPCSKAEIIKEDWFYE